VEKGYGVQRKEKDPEKGACGGGKQRRGEKKRLLTGERGEGGKCEKGVEGRVEKAEIRRGFGSEKIKIRHWKESTQAGKEREKKTKKKKSVERKGGGKKIG